MPRILLLLITIALAGCAPTFLMSEADLRYASNSDLCGTDIGMIGYSKVRKEIQNRKLDCDDPFTRRQVSRDKSQRMAMYAGMMGTLSGSDVEKSNQEEENSNPRSSSSKSQCRSMEIKCPSGSCPDKNLPLCKADQKVLNNLKRCGASVC